MIRHCLSLYPASPSVVLQGQRWEMDHRRQRLQNTELHLGRDGRSEKVLNSMMTSSCQLHGRVTQTSVTLVIIVSAELFPSLPMIHSLIIPESSEWHRSTSSCGIHPIQTRRGYTGCGLTAQYSLRRHCVFLRVLPNIEQPAPRVTCSRARQITGNNPRVQHQRELPV